MLQNAQLAVIALVMHSRRAGAIDGQLRTEESSAIQVSCGVSHVREGINVGGFLRARERYDKTLHIRQGYLPFSSDLDI